MLDGLLEILLITYNRAEFLKRTLNDLLGSPFRECKITLLDNCSTDETPLICYEMKPFFPKMRIIRHKKNIGGNANYLRAVEISESKYTWVICDDDTFDFSASHDVIKAVIASVDDIIIVRPVCDGGVVKIGRTTSRELIGADFMYYFTLSFFPAIIFRTELFDSDCLMHGYRFIPDSYPQFGFINKSVLENFTVYIPDPPLVIRNDVNVSTFSPLSWYKAWISCSSSIEDPKIRKETISQATRFRGFFKSIAFWIALEKKINSKDFFRKIGTIFLLMDPLDKLFFLVFIPLIIVPLPFSFLLSARRFVYWVLGVPKDQIPPVEFDQQL